MKLLRILVFIIPFFFLTSATQILVITFSFDLYIAEVKTRNLSIQKDYRELIDIIWEQAQYLASARIYGLHFSYFSSSAWNSKADFTIQPEALIAKGNQQLKITNINQLNPSHFEVNVRYICTTEESIRYRKFQEQAITLNPSQGMIPYSNEIIFFKKALENSFYQAIQSYAKQRNLNQIEGKFILLSNRPLLIKSGFAIQYSQIQLIIETPVPFRI